MGPAFRCGILPLAKMVSANNVPIGLARNLRSETYGFSSLRITGSTISIKAPCKQYKRSSFVSVNLYKAVLIRLWLKLFAGRALFSDFAKFRSAEVKNNLLSAHPGAKLPYWK